MKLKLIEEGATQPDWSEGKEGVGGMVREEKLIWVCEGGKKEEGSLGA